VHQPLHISFADNAGGNLIQVTGIGCPNMHSLWDTCMIAKQNKSNAQLVSDLLGGLPASAVMQSWQNDPPETWANESLTVTLDPQTQYCQIQGNACISVGTTVALTNNYVVQNFPVVQLRMQKAAVRMAGVLKDLLSD
jgi:hypothetical protein